MGKLVLSAIHRNIDVHVSFPLAIIIMLRASLGAVYWKLEVAFYDLYLLA